MNLKNLFFLMLNTIYIISCKSDDNNLFRFDPRMLKENEITLSEFGDDISYIALDNTFPLNITNSSIKFVNNAIYLNSRDLGILVFDRNGKFINKIGSIGRGPGEYIIYLNFCIDDKSGSVYVKDIGNIVKVFSKTGHYIRSFSLKEYGSSIQNIGYFNSKFFVQYAIQSKFSDYEWLFCDTIGNLIKKQGRHLPQFTTNWGGEKPIYIFKNQLSYFNDFADTIFSIKPDLDEEPSMIISPGEHRFLRSNLSPEQLSSGKYLNLIKIFETSSFFIIIYHYYKYYMAIIDKDNNKSFLIDLKDWNDGNFLNGIYNDIDGGSFFVPKEYFSENGKEYMVSLIYPYQIKALVTSDKFKNSDNGSPDKKKELKKLADSLKETDNPILMVVRLKK